mmetsp:Transcript_30229/g.48820  ORF Transcript_30229/g.48820 Transcript_30229/m.48820 type:complete len:1043 (-) Transcript_30229:208-3336(-)
MERRVAELKQTVAEKEQTITRLKAFLEQAEAKARLFEGQLKTAQGVLNELGSALSIQRSFLGNDDANLGDRLVTEVRRRTASTQRATALEESIRDLFSILALGPQSGSPSTTDGMIAQLRGFIQTSKESQVNMQRSLGHVAEVLGLSSKADVETVEKKIRVVVKEAQEKTNQVEELRKSISEYKKERDLSNTRARRMEEEARGAKKELRQAISLLRLKEEDSKQVAAKLAESQDRVQDLETQLAYVGAGRLAEGNDSVVEAGVPESPCKALIAALSSWNTDTLNTQCKSHSDTEDFVKHLKVYVGSLYEILRTITLWDQTTLDDRSLQVLARVSEDDTEAATHFLRNVQELLRALHRDLKSLRESLKLPGSSINELKKRVRGLLAKEEVARAAEELLGLDGDATPGALGTRLHQLKTFEGVVRKFGLDENTVEQLEELVTVCLGREATPSVRDAISRMWSLKAMEEVVRELLAEEEVRDVSGDAIRKRVEDMKRRPAVVEKGGKRMRDLPKRATTQEPASGTAVAVVIEENEGTEALGSELQKEDPLEGDRSSPNVRDNKVTRLQVSSTGRIGDPRIVDRLSDASGLKDWDEKHVADALQQVLQQRAQFFSVGLGTASSIVQGIVPSVDDCWSPKLKALVLKVRATCEERTSRLSLIRSPVRTAVGENDPLQVALDNLIAEHEAVRVLSGEVYFTFLRILRHPLIERMGGMQERTGLSFIHDSLQPANVQLQRLKSLGAQVVHLLDGAQSPSTDHQSQAPSAPASPPDAQNGSAALSTPSLPSPPQGEGSQSESAQMERLIEEIRNLVQILYKFIPLAKLEPRQQKEVQTTLETLTNGNTGTGKLELLLKLINVKDERIRELQRRAREFADIVYQGMELASKIVNIEVLRHDCYIPECEEFRRRAVKAEKGWKSASKEAKDAHDALRSEILRHRKMISEQEEIHERFVKAQRKVLFGEEWRCPICDSIPVMMAEKKTGDDEPDMGSERKASDDTTDAGGERKTSELSSTCKTIGQTIMLVVMTIMLVVMMLVVLNPNLHYYI